jgi:hypothetical protein
MKKVTQVALVGMLIILFAGCSSGTGDSSGGNKASSQKAITEFSINGIEGAINEEDKTIDVNGMPFNTNVSALDATFTTTGESVRVGTTEQVSSETPNDFTNPVIYTVTAEDNSTEDYVVTVTVVPSPQKEFTAFSLDESAGVIDETDKTIAVNLPAGTDITDLIATYTTTGVSVKVGSVFQASGQTVNDFTDPVVYTVTAADMTTQDYTVMVTATQTVPDENRPAIAVKVSMKPNNSSKTTNANVLCVNSLSVTGSETVNDPDGGTVIVREWYVNGVLKASGANVFTGPFIHSDIITYKVTADGVVSDSISAQVA